MIKWTLLLLLLGGCASLPQGPAPITTSTQVVSADKAVGVACVDPVDVPTVPAPIAPPAELMDCETLSCLRRKVVALADYVKALREYVNLADPIFRQCSITPTKGTP